MKELSISTENSDRTESLDQYFKRFEGQPYFYGNASHAFYDVMVWLQKNRPKKNPNIVMPVYIPAKLYRFILAAGYEPKFYDVPTDLNIDLKEIRGLIDEQTQAVFAVHFFGIPVDLQPLKSMTTIAGVYLVEDCAHSINATYKGRKIGTTGDCALFSTRKMMQLHCGGILVLNSKPWNFKPSRNERVSSLFTVYHFVGSRVKYSVNHVLKGYSPFRLPENSYNGYIDFTEEHSVRVKRMDSFTKWYGNIPDLDKMADTRRRKALFLLNGIHDLDSFYPIGVERYARKEETDHYSLNSGFVPFSIPILTPVGAREQIKKALYDAGVPCFAGWPEAPFGHPGFKGAEVLKDRLLELPVHPFIGSHQLHRMVDCLNSM